MSDFATTARRGPDSSADRRREQERVREAPKPTVKAEAKIAWTPAEPKLESGASE